MEETLTSPKMAESDLINFLEKWSPRYLIRLKNTFFKGFLRTRTHQIEIDLEKKIIAFSYKLKI